MSAKPSAPATWDSTLTHIVAPTAGHIASGFANNEVPGSGELNGQLNLIGQWTEYVNDGDVALNDLSLNGLSLLGKKALALALGNTADVDLDGTTHNVGACYVDVTWSGSSSPTAARAITGVANPTDGRVLVLHNSEEQNPAGSYSSHRVALYQDHVSSTAGNRIWLPNGALGLSVSGTPGCVIPPGGIVVLRYDASFVNPSTGVTGYWMVVASSFKLAGGYKTVTVPLVPGSGTFVASQTGGTGSVGITHLQSDGSAANWSVWSSDIQGVQPGDTVVGLNVLAHLVGAYLLVTLLEKTLTAAPAFTVNTVASTNAGASLAVSGTTQYFQITGLTWAIGSDATYYCQFDGSDGNAVGAGSEAVYMVQLLVAQQAG